MSELNSRSNDAIVPNDGSYLGAKKFQALRDKKVKEDFDKAWKNQKELLKDNLVKLYKDKANIGVQWQSHVDWDDSKLIEPKIKRTLNALGRGKFCTITNYLSS